MIKVGPNEGGFHRFGGGKKQLTEISLRNIINEAYIHLGKRNFGRAESLFVTAFQGSADHVTLKIDALAGQIEVYQHQKALFLTEGSLHNPKAAEIKESLIIEKKKELFQLKKSAGIGEQVQPVPALVPEAAVAETITVPASMTKVTQIIPHVESEEAKRLLAEVKAALLGDGYLSACKVLEKNGRRAFSQKEMCSDNEIFNVQLNGKAKNFFLSIGMHLHNIYELLFRENADVRLAFFNEGALYFFFQKSGVWHAACLENGNVADLSTFGGRVFSVKDVTEATANNVAGGKKHVFTPMPVKIIKKVPIGNWVRSFPEFLEELEECLLKKPLKAAWSLAFAEKSVTLMNDSKIVSRNEHFHIDITGLHVELFRRFGLDRISNLRELLSGGGIDRRFAFTKDAATYFYFRKGEAWGKVVFKDGVMIESAHLGVVTFQSEVPLIPSPRVEPVALQVEPVVSKIEPVEERGVPVKKIAPKRPSRPQRIAEPVLSKPEPVIQELEEAPVTHPALKTAEEELLTFPVDMLTRARTLFLEVPGARLLGYEELQTVEIMGHFFQDFSFSRKAHADFGALMGGMEIEYIMNYLSCVAKIADPQSGERHYYYFKKDRSFFRLVADLADKKILSFSEIKSS